MLYDSSTIYKLLVLFGFAIFVLFIDGLSDRAVWVILCFFFAGTIIESYTIKKRADNIKTAFVYAYIRHSLDDHDIARGIAHKYQLENGQSNNPLFINIGIEAMDALTTGDKFIRKYYDEYYDKFYKQ